MPALDQCHAQVIRALEKAGWRVSPRPFMIHLDKLHRVHMDIQAISSEARTILIIEVKCFNNPQAETTDLYTAIGQYLVYRQLIADYGIHAELYLAVPERAYNGVINRLGQPVMQAYHVKMVVVDMEHEVIIQWTE